MKTLIAYTDGGSRGNPGPSACAVHIPDTNHSFGYYIGQKTNNEAEYEALYAALKYSLDIGVTHLIVYTDSELMARQVTGRYRMKSESLRPYLERVKSQIAQLKAFEIHEVRRAYNAAADAECNRILDAHEKEGS